MNSENISLPPDNRIKVPTILGLSLLLLGIITGVLLLTQRQILLSHANQTSAPKNITVANISDTSVSIYWQTDNPATGFIVANPPAGGLTFKDDRDLKGLEKHLLHFVTLTKLIPNTTYHYKITSDGVSFPLSGDITFKTEELASSSKLPALIGSILDSPSSPVDEALVTLTIPNQTPLAAITKTSGSFILPLNNLQANSITPIQLLIFNAAKFSRINLNLPLQNNTLPAILLGQNLDLDDLGLTKQLTSPTATITIPTPLFSKYDLNKDGLVNSVDVSITVKNFGKNPKLKEADSNNDGIVNQQDLDLINSFVNQAIPK